MIKVIGKSNCNKCEMTKSILNKNNITFTYELFEDLDENNQNHYINLALSSEQFIFPLIFIDNQIINLTDLMEVNKCI